MSRSSGFSFQLLRGHSSEHLFYPTISSSCKRKMSDSASTWWMPAGTIESLSAAMQPLFQYKLFSIHLQTHSRQCNFTLEWTILIKIGTPATSHRKTTQYITKSKNYNILKLKWEESRLSDCKISWELLNPIAGPDTNLWWDHVPFVPRHVP